MNRFRLLSKRLCLIRRWFSYHSKFCCQCFTHPERGLARDPSVEVVINAMQVILQQDISETLTEPGIWADCRFLHERSRSSRVQPHFEKILVICSSLMFSRMMVSRSNPVAPDESELVAAGHFWIRDPSSHRSRIAASGGSRGDSDRW